MYVYQVIQVVYLRSRSILAPIGASDRRCVYITKCYTRRCRMLYIRVAITHCRTGPAPTCGLAGPLFFHLVWEHFCRMDHLFQPFFTAPDHLRIWVDRHPVVYNVTKHCTSCNNTLIYWHICYIIAIPCLGKLGTPQHTTIIKYIYCR